MSDKRRSRHGKGPRPRPTKEVANVVQAQPLSAEQQAAAVQRVAKSFRELAKPPEGFVEWLERLEIPYVIQDFGDGEQCLVVSMRDLIEGEGRNQSKGSVLQQIYGDKQAELTGMFKQMESKWQGREGDALHG